MANLDLSQSVGGLTAASRFLRMLIAPNILKAARVDRSDQNLALRDLRWVEEDRGSEIDRGEVDVIVGEIIESDVGEMGRGRARPSERASGLETDGMTQTDGRTDAQQSGSVSDHHRNVRSGFINSSYAVDIGGPQKRNPSPRCLRT